MPDEQFEDAYLASLYERVNPWGPDEEFYLHLIASAERVVDGARRERGADSERAISIWPRPPWWRKSQ